MNDGVLKVRSIGMGAVTRKMVRERAVELAVTNGRTPQEVSKVDWEQAKRELTMDSDAGSKAAIVESTPESARWDPVPGSTGNKSPAAPGADEDEEGRSDHERLVDEGMADAEHDQRRQATSE